MKKINYDPVNRPSHYTDSKFEAIDIIQDKMSPEEFEGYLKGNILKYVMRSKKKGEPKQDLEKAQWYLSKLISTLK